MRMVRGFTDLEGLQEGPQQDADGVAEPQQLDEAHGAEQAEEARVDPQLRRLALQRTTARHVKD